MRNTSSSIHWFPVNFLEWDVTIAYAAGAASVGFATDESDAWEATVGYDLGGGASFNAGVNEGETSYASVGFSF